MADQPIKPWEQQPGEPLLWFARFEIYRRLGSGRNLLEAYKIERSKANKSVPDVAPGNWNTNCRKWKWRDRAAQYDKAQIAINQQADADELTEMFARHKNQALLLQSLSQTKLKRLHELAKADPSILDDWSPNAAAATLIDGQRQERLARGVPEKIERQEQTGKDGGAILTTEVEVRLTRDGDNGTDNEADTATVNRISGIDEGPEMGVQLPSGADEGMG